MFQPFSLCLRLFILFLAICCGACAGLIKPSLPDASFFTPLSLDGPYDADIPPEYVSRLKAANSAGHTFLPYAFLGIAAYFEELGDEERCVHFHERAIAQFRQNGNTTGQAVVEARKIAALMKFGETKRASALTDELENKGAGYLPEAFIVYNRAGLRLQNGDYVRAGLHFRQTLALCADEPDDPEWLMLKRDALYGLGLARLAGGYFTQVAGKLLAGDSDEQLNQKIRDDVPETLSVWEQALAANEKIKQTRAYRFFPEAAPAWLECDLLNYLGLSSGIAGRTQEALSHLEAAARAARAAGYVLGEADSMLFLCHVHLLNKNERVASRRALRTLSETARRLRLVSYSVWAQLLGAHYAREEKDTQQALKATSHALALVEGSSPWYPSRAGVRGGGFFDLQALYEVVVEMEVAEGGETRAFRIAERSKASLMKSRLAHELSLMDFPYDQDAGALKLCQAQLSQEYTKLLMPGPPGAVARILQNIELSESSRVLLMERLKNSTSPLGKVYSLSVPEPDELKRLLESNKTVFSYFTGRLGLYVWVVSGKKMRFKELPMTKQEVNRLTDAYRGALMSGDRAAADELAQKAYDAFLKPVIHFVDGDSIGLSLHGPLCRVPFASLRYAGSYLVDGFTIFYLPHAGMVKPSPRPADAVHLKQTLIISDPRCADPSRPAPYNAKELAAVKKIFPKYDELHFTELPTGRKPSGVYDVLHWSLYDCPGGDALDDSYAPGQSAKRRDSCPRAEDLFEPSLSAKTAFLSSCRPARSSSGKSGLSALTGVWLYAISPFVVTQLWEVPDTTRGVFIKLYYESLKKSGDTVYSLTVAQNEMIQAGYGPSDWAAFVVSGRY